MQISNAYDFSITCFQKTKDDEDFMFLLAPGQQQSLNPVRLGDIFVARNQDTGEAVGTFFATK